jgi:hypothetical protein
MPSAGVRFAGETAFLILVALGLGLAEFDPVVIGVVMFVAWVLVALLERASSKEAERAAGAEPTPEPAAAPPPHVERIEVEPVAVDVRPPEPAPEPTPEPEPEPTVSERSARAILASGPPPLPPEPTTKEKPKPKPARRRLIVERRPEPPPPPPPEPEPEPEPEPVVQGPPREWNLWELERSARSAPDDERQQEWTALLIHLREFANADGDLPIEFDSLVRESFGDVLAPEPEPATAS